MDIVVGLDDIQRRIWGFHEAVPWMKLSDFMSKGTVTQNRTIAGELVIVNWGALQVVSYDNPWTGIDSAHAIKI